MRSSTLVRRPSWSIRVLIVLTLSIGLVSVACGGSSAAAPAHGLGDTVSDGGPVAAGSAGPAAKPPADQGSGGGGSSTGGGSPNGGTDAVAIFDDAKIVRTGSLELTVDNVANALTSARDAIRGLGGYIGASQQQRSDDQTVASVTYRIPVARWEEALDAIRGLGTEVSEKTDATEVTGQIVDVAARIRNLKASETALVGYAAQAPKVADLLEIQARLTDTRGEIERLTAQQTQLEDQAAMATLTVTFGTEVVAVTETAQRWDPGAEVDRAAATLIAVGQALASVAIVFVIVWLPLLLAVTLIAAIVLVIARRLGWSRPTRMPPLAPPPTSAEL
jgi:Domain of unknown function (DUF4349)